MNRPDSMDEMMRTYFQRQEEPFTYKKRSRKNLHVPALIVALLVLTIIISLCTNHDSKPAIAETENMAENSVNIVAATAVIEKPLSGAPNTETESVGGKNANSVAKKVGIFVIDGENLYGLKSRSLYQDATFFRIRNSDLKQNWRLEWDAYTDLNGQEYTRENIITPSDTFANVDEDGYYKWYVTGELADRIALAYAPTQNLSDVVETVIYFNDGSFIRKIYDIGYEGDAMVIYEREETIEGYDAP